MRRWTISCNPRPGAGRGGDKICPPLLFSTINGKRLIVAIRIFQYLPENEFQAFCASFNFLSGQVRSPGQVKLPSRHMTVPLIHDYARATVLEASIWDFEDYIRHIYKTFILEFWCQWPQVRSTSWPRHYELMWKCWNAYHVWQFEIQRCAWPHWTCLVKTRWLVCHMTCLHHQVTWRSRDLRPNLIINLSRSRCKCFDVKWREEHDGGQPITLAWKTKKLFAKKLFLKI